MKNKTLRIYFSATKPLEENLYELKSTVREAVKATLAFEGFLPCVTLSVTFTDNEGIRLLNSAHRNIDKPTDVLSFPIYEREEIADMSPDEPVMLGDIVISLERARVQAEEVGNEFLTELAFLTVHSTLHLLGYDHTVSIEEDELQCAHQREIMKKLDKRKI
jgi:probable rRNA maturation factor